MAGDCEIIWLYGGRARPSCRTHEKPACILPASGVKRLQLVVALAALTALALPCEQVPALLGCILVRRPGYAARHPRFYQSVGHELQASSWADHPSLCFFDIVACFTLTEPFIPVLCDFRTQFPELMSSSTRYFSLLATETRDRVLTRSCIDDDDKDQGVQSGQTHGPSMQTENYVSTIV